MFYFSVPQSAVTAEPLVCNPLAWLDECMRDIFFKSELNILTLHFVITNTKVKIT